jgi:hypothetical protein
MKKNIISIIYSCCFVLACFQLNAQGGTTGNDGKLNDEIQVLSSFNATLLTSNKLRTTPAIPTNSANQNERLDYELPTRLLELAYEPPVIRPLTMQADKIPKIYNFYGKLGYGIPNMPYAELHYNSGRSDKLDYGIFLNHHSANNSKNVANQQFSNTDFAANLTTYTKGFGLGGNFGYTFDQYNFYGTNATDTIPPSADTMRQRFNTIKIGAHFFNANPTAIGVNYRGNLDMYRIGGSYGEADFGMKLKGEFAKAFKQNTLAIGLYNDFNSFNKDTSGANNNILGLKPSFTMSGEAFSLKIGANLGLESDSGAFVLPDLQGSYSFAGEKFTILAGWTGEYIKNSYYSATEENPFIFAPLDLRNTKMQKFYGGLKLSLDGIQLQGVVAQKLVTNLQLYQNDTSEYRFFKTAYDNGSVFNIHGEALVTLVKNLEISAVVDFNTYNLDNQVRAWHLPNFEGNFSAAYRLLDEKLKVKAELYLANSIPYLDEAGDERVLAGVIDLSLGATYSINEKFGVFLDLNNITAQQYVRYYRYPNYGFNLLAGVTGRF